MIIVPLLQGEEPDKASNDKHDNCIRDKDVVQDDKTYRDMVLLDDSTDREYERCYKHDTHNQGSWNHVLLDKMSARIATKMYAPVKSAFEMVRFRRMSCLR